MTSNFAIEQTYSLPSSVLRQQDMSEVPYKISTSKLHRGSSWQKGFEREGAYELRMVMRIETSEGPAPFPMSSSTVIKPRANPLLSGSFTFNSTALHGNGHSQ